MQNECKKCGEMEWIHLGSTVTLCNLVVATLCLRCTDDWHEYAAYSRLTELWQKTLDEIHTVFCQITCDGVPRDAELRTLRLQEHETKIAIRHQIERWLADKNPQPKAELDLRLPKSVRGL